MRAQATRPPGIDVSFSPFTLHAPRSQGFTLIEILVVVLIVGILAGFAMLSIGNRTQDDHLDTEARRLDRLLAIASEQAELQGIEIGLHFDGKRYEFLTLSPEGAWAPLTDSGPLRARAIPEPLQLALSVEGRPVTFDAKTEELTPQLLLLSSGEATPFRLDLQTPGVKGAYRIEGDPLGRRTLERVAAEDS